ncbi:hypothetical protein [Ralstonia pseudosolanacearum]|uniref:Uncharacterized protein n=1 Tax=Ralstonia solanacearum TaxID=305 RepID=A0AA92IE49_RALSL|nr:hypothetical protein [Ralstonia pseudosolanacearum]QCX49697.1 hypothetical protein E7Z57_11705 [Ralstonia pseudosolanacearum]
MITNGQTSTGKQTAGNLNTQTECRDTSVEDLQAEIEQAEISRTLFEREFETMRRAVSAKVRKKADLYVWLKAKGFTQGEKEFLALWAKKMLEAKTDTRSSSPTPSSADAMQN